MSASCPTFPAVPSTPTVRFPSGVSLQGSVPGDDFPTPLGFVTSLLNQAGPVMSALNPFFKILDVILKLVKTVEAIPDSIASLNPGPIIDALVDLGKAVAEVVKLIPQLSVPVMIVDLIDLIILALQGIVGELTAISGLQAQADNLRTVMAEANLPDTIATCIEDSMQAQSDALSAALGPIGQILDLMTILTKLAGLPEMPSLDGFESPSEGIELIGQVVDILTDIRNSIPV